MATDLRRLIGALLPLALLAGCDCGSGTGHDGPDRADAATDARADSGLDAASDAAADAAVDAATDGGGSADAAVDAGEPAVDAGVDAAVEPDAGPEVLTCTSCHGEGDESAPPLDTLWRRDTALPTVGAHRYHVRSSPVFRTGLCTNCHVVPDTIDAPGHIDESPAELVWGEIPTTDGVVADYDGSTCSVYCHGVTLPGGEVTEPDWTGGHQAYCGACHGVPPPEPHPVVDTCAGCHPFQGFVPLDPERHVDGILDLSVDCNSCHGGPDGPAPPADTHGNEDTGARGVGAHAEHLADSDWRAPIACTDCHAVPGDVGDPDHIDGDGIAELVWGQRANADGAAPDWDGVSCDGVYCHGATLSGGTETTPTWTQVDGSQDACGTCHGLPPTENHTASDQCSACHAPVVDDQRNIVRPDLHINGTVEVDPNASCGACHDLPPASGTHLLHASSAEPVYGGLATAGTLGIGNAYAFGCGNCHPLDPAQHMNGGLAEIELHDAAAPAGSLKALSPVTATYQPGAFVQEDAFGLEYTLGTCSDVYCHSGMTTTSGDVPEPGVDFGFAGYPIVYPPYDVTRTRQHTAVTWGGDLGCDGCHGYPPRGQWPDVTAGAGESHAFLDPDGYEDLHLWNHGFDPVPCRTCHYQTIRAVATFARDGAGITTLDPVAIAGFDRHVDGVIDVAFDTVDPLGLYPDPLDLGPAVWDANARTCSNIACHFYQTTVGFGAPYRYSNGLECNACHQY